MNKYAVASVVSLVFAGIAQGADALEPAPKPSGPASPWYVGAGFSQIFASIPEQTINGIDSVLSTANGAAFSVLDKDKRSPGSKFFVGYGFNPYFAVESGIAWLGKSSVNMDFRSGINSVGHFHMDYKMTAAFIDAVGMLPVSDKWSFIGRVGVSYSRVSSNLNGEPLTIIVSENDKSESKVREKFGAGIDYNMNPKVTIRAEWERYKMPDPLSDEKFNVDAATLSLLYHF